jgi:CMP-N-acetylneuraminic acid synthetase
MSTKSLDRLMFVQGGLCFFCKKPLSKADASVEHLLASAKAGSNHDDNCVVCCKSFNALLGSMSLKEKFQVFSQSPAAACRQAQTISGIKIEDRQIHYGRRQSEAARCLETANTKDAQEHDRLSLSKGYFRSGSHCLDSAVAVERRDLSHGEQSVLCALKRG